MNRRWRHYLAFWGVRVERDVEDELSFHLEMLVHDYIARGMSETDARRAAEHRVGNLPRARSACVTIGHRRRRRMARAQTIDTLMQDVRYALRTLGRSKGWTSVALLTLALGIGASTAMFSVLNSLILSPLRYPGADRVATLWRTPPNKGVLLTPRVAMTTAWEKNARSLEAFEPYGRRRLVLGSDAGAVEVAGAVIRPDFPTFAGAPLVAGRTFAPDEMIAGAARVVIIGEGLWRERFGGSRAAIGKTLTLDDAPFTVIGVASAAMRLPEIESAAPQVWLPLVPDTAGFSSPTVVRVRKNVSMEAAAMELDSIAARAGIEEKFGKYVTQLARPADFVDFRSSLFLLSGAVALLLVVACANVAHLSLARGATRSRELAIRAALGAGRGRLLRQLLTESLLLAILGGILGVAVAVSGLKILLVVRPARLGALSAVTIDSTALWVALGLSAFAGIAFGITAAIDSVRHTTSESLRNTAIAGTATRQTHRLRSALVVTEMALSAMLLVTAALLVRSVVRLRAVDPGFQVADLYSAHFDLPDKRYPTASSKRDFMRQVVDRARMIPTVKSVATTHSIPPESGIMLGDLEADGIQGLVSHGTIADSPVGATFFATVGIPIIEGATFTPGADERNEVIINRGFARSVWPGQPAIGKRIRSAQTTRNEKWMTIVGVVGDVARYSLRGDRTLPILYTPVGNADGYPPTTVAIRGTSGSDPTDALRAIAKALDPRLPPPAVTTAAAGLAETVATDAFTMMLLAVFAGLAVVLSAIGLYGVISYVVTQRTREIGIRVALGATPRHVATSVVARGVILSMLGLAIGLGLSIWGTKLIRSTLYGVTGADAVSYTTTALVLLAVSVVACLRPMARALSIDPVIAMRGD